MRKLILIFALFLSFWQGFSQTKEEIISIISQQQSLWNKGDIPGFMEYYWKSDSLQFIGQNGVVHGWNATLARYRKNYPDLATMGTLKFDIKEVDLLSGKSAWVLGQWHLTRPEKGDIGGYFTLIFKKIKGRWLIVSDHTS
jgi:ketosteroid isomerase-like protein